MRRITDNVYLFWAVLTLPAIWFLLERLVLHGKVPLRSLTGVLSCWLLIVTMLVTPLQLLSAPCPG
ncbi:MAG: hypothetical protein R3D61_09630 [Defluviimonas denitrificans]